MPRVILNVFAAGEASLNEFNMLLQLAKTVRVQDLWMSFYAVDIFNPEGSCVLLLLL